MGEFLEQISKMVLLQTIDQRWKEHLLVIDKLKEGIGLRGYAQKDPLIEYKKEAYNAFEALNNAIKADAIEKIMKVQIMAQDAAKAVEQFRPEETDLSGLDYQGGDELGGNDTMMMEAGRGPSSAPAEAPAPTRRKVTMVSRSESDEPKLNRADRRRVDKRRR